MPLSLPDVTICAADCLTPALAARALDRSTALCAFGDAILFSDTPVAGHFRNIAIGKLRSKQDYSRFILKDLAAHIKTPFVLVAQWDGYVIDAASWRDEFKTYDYIGARFQTQEGGVPVGNGGFSLRSVKLLKAIADPDFRMDADKPEDDLICRINRDLLTRKYGITFAPPELAEQFSYEWVPPAGPTFGFHGLANMWRHVDDSEMIMLVQQMTPGMIRSHLFVALLVAYQSMQKFALWRTLYHALRRVATPAEIAAFMTPVINPTKSAADVVQAWDRTLD